jgi:hypothetical protein
MLRFLPYGIELFLVVFCLIDCIQSDEAAIRNLGKAWWVLLILFFPLVGAIAWLVAGRPVNPRRRTVPWPSQTAGYPESERPRRTLAPDDDPEFLAEMRKGNAEQEELLRKWEDDLRRRERDLGKDDDDPPPPAPPPPTSAK